MSGLWVRLSEERSGSMAITGAITMLLMVATGALTINYMTAFRIKREAQNAMDAAVLAGTKPPSGTTDDDRIAFALASFDGNRRLKTDTTSEFTVQEGAMPTFSVNGTSVSGRADLVVKNPFANAFSRPTIELTVESQAVKLSGEPICVLGLDGNEAETIDVNGNATINATNCAIQANSKDGEGLHQVGASSMRAKQIGVVGNYEGTNYQPIPTTGVDPIADPYAGLRPPLIGPCVPDVPNKFQQATVTLEAGTYCGGLDIKASSNVTLMPGIYIMRDGLLTVQSGSTLIGDEVMLYFVGENATFYIMAGAVVRLTSPRMGEYANMQIFADPMTFDHRGRALYGTVIGDSVFSFDGVIYAPTQHVWYAGGSVVTGTSPSYITVAKKIWIQDNSDVTFTQVNSRGVAVPTAQPMSYGARLVR